MVIPIVTIVAALIAVAAACVALAASAEARAGQRALDRDRHHFNQTMNYQHPRSLR